MDTRGNCLLTDFGIAKIVEGTAKFTGTSGVIGTPAYMSPEQGRGDKVDARTDVYALGVVLYEMVTGRVPFDAETPIAIVFKHIQDPLPPPSTLNPDVPDALERVILKALAKDPNDRFAATGEMVQALQAALPDVTQPAIPAPTVPEKKIPPPTPALRPKWLLPAIGAGAAVACLALIAVIGGAFMTGLIGGTPAPTTPFMAAAAPATTAAPNVIASPTVAAASSWLVLGMR
ncbi:MAG: protein kinase, partial [Chloroflexota bacterium]